MVPVELPYVRCLQLYRPAVTVPASNMFCCLCIGRSFSVVLKSSYMFASCDDLKVCRDDCVADSPELENMFFVEHKLSSSPLLTVGVKYNTNLKLGLLCSFTLYRTVTELERCIRGINKVSSILFHAPMSIVGAIFSAMASETN